MTPPIQPPRYAFLTDAAPADEGGHGCHVLARQWLKAAGNSAALVVTHPPPWDVRGRLTAQHAGQPVCWYRVAPRRIYHGLPVLTLILLAGQLPELARKIAASSATRLFALCGADFWYLASVRMIQGATGLPLDIYLVDDMEESARLQHRLSPPGLVRTLERQVLRKASRVYAISPGFASHLSGKYGVRAQWLPIPVLDQPTPYHPLPSAQTQSRKIVFAGAVNPLYASALRELLAEIENWNNAPSPFALRLQVLSYTPETEIRCWLGNSPALEIQVGSTDADLRRFLEESWAIFLPYSFDDQQRAMVSTSFSLKFNNAITCGRPILVYGPEYASIPSYFRAEGLPLCVTAPNGLGQALQEIECFDSPGLIARYHALIQANHSSTALAQRLAGPLETSNP